MDRTAMGPRRPTAEAASPGQALIRSHSPTAWSEAATCPSRQLRLEARSQLKNGSDPAGGHLSIILAVEKRCLYAASPTYVCDDGGRSVTARACLAARLTVVLEPC